MSFFPRLIQAALGGNYGQTQSEKRRQRRRAAFVLGGTATSRKIILDKDSSCPSGEEAVLQSSKASPDGKITYESGFH